ncbi:heparan-alpha-glucosaminide N-acetyltransferase domain-containing protein [Bacteroidota bacterium]
MSTKKRIIFLDLMRAFAVLMMVQGHTIHTLLAEEYRSADYLFYSIWVSLRGFTAPIFMFTSGVVFTYLLGSNFSSFRDNPRVKKGIKRFLLLLVIGYLLRYPTYKVFDFSYVTDKQWLMFFAVDALHLIAFGLLFILIFVYISEKTGFKKSVVLIFGALFFILLYPITKNINWADIFPLPVAAYFYSDTGSLFPLFPWAGYVVGGGILGNYIAKNPVIVSSKDFSFRLLLTGICFAAFSFFISQLGKIISVYDSSWSYSLSMVFYRIGIVLVLNGIMSLIAVKTRDIPNVIKQIGRHTLLIYVVHLIMLYGCAWIPGMYKFYSQTFSFELTLVSAVVMLLLMISMVVVFEKIKLVRKNKISAATV